MPKMSLVLKLFRIPMALANTSNDLKSSSKINQLFQCPLFSLTWSTISRRRWDKVHHFRCTTKPRWVTGLLETGPRAGPSKSCAHYYWVRLSERHSNGHWSFCARLWVVGWAGLKAPRGPWWSVWLRFSPLPTPFSPLQLLNLWTCYSQQLQPSTTSKKAEP